MVVGFRWHKKGAATMIGSLLLGLYDDDHMLHHVGVAATFTATVRKQLVVELTPLHADALEDHPWRNWAVAQEEANAKGQRRPGASSRWTRGKDLSWQPLRPERVCGHFFIARNGLCMLNASARMPCSTCFHITGTAIGKPGPTRGDHAATAVLPRPLRR